MKFLFQIIETSSSNLSAMFKPRTLAWPLKNEELGLGPGLSGSLSPPNNKKVKIITEICMVIKIKDKRGKANTFN